MRAALIALLLWGAALPAAARCRLALALGFDVSASVNDHQYGLMMRGTATALRDPEVRAAALTGAPVALVAYVWAGRREQAVAAWWTLVEHEADLDAFAARIEAFPRPAGDPLGVWSNRTGVGAALLAGARLFDRGPACDARTIDLASDGETNDGPRSARLDGITVNALAIGGDLLTDHEGATTPPLSDWYRTFVIQGPGAFVMIADSYDDFAEAMRRKLLRELTPLLLGQLGG
ncbi:MAG: hypothetical protein Kow0013_06240 [Pararhodobacter sp.]